MTHEFDLDTSSILGAVNEETKFIFLCSPNNPTGRHIPIPIIRKILDLGLPTLIDEAYYELGRKPRTCVPLLDEFPNLIISRTFSKAYGLAGLRVGYAFASPLLIECMDKVKLPWNVSILTFAAVLAQLGDIADLKQKLELIVAGREYIQAELSTIPGLKVYPSEGNFLLIDGSGLGFSSNDIYEAMRDQYKIQLRPMQAHHGRDGLVRITVATEEENRACVEGLKQLFSNGQ
jgi:histidinol-phosphate aminotransferase